MLTKFFIILICIYKSAANMEPKVVGPEANIVNYPHSAFILVIAIRSTDTSTYLCGSSILNQRILLTAAHCILEPLLSGGMMVFVGHSNNFYGDRYPVADKKTHEHYHLDTVANDIGLILVQENIKFRKEVQRVSITPRKQSEQYAAVAGWGMTDEDLKQNDGHLHHAILKVIPYETCRKRIQIPEGCICAKDDNGKHYPAAGDSGSALVVKGYIQIAVASFKMPQIDRTLVVFSNVTYFYKWIKINAKRLYCNSGLGLGLNN